VATIETSYRGPEDSTYNHKRISSAGAVGPMQIMPKYASWFAGFPVKRQELKDSIELNVWLSMKILNYQYNRFGTWEKALGAYNTGRPIINSYAKKAINPKYYLSKWM
jgi:soluble lytic murein transglycosylase-like protein